MYSRQAAARSTETMAHTTVVSHAVTMEGMATEAPLTLSKHTDRTAAPNGLAIGVSINFALGQRKTIHVLPPQ